MLRRLRIDSFALIDEVEIEFGSGLCVITGETGAGKSILIGALNSILGGPVTADLVRGGADRCQVEALFDFQQDDDAITRLAQFDFDLDEGQLILRREIRAEGGRSRAFVNDSLVPVRELRAIGRALVDLHGQHEHQSLLDPERHVHFLDKCSGLSDDAAATAESYHRLSETIDVVRLLTMERDRLKDEEELRRYQLDEIQHLAPELGEDERLEAEVSRLENQQLLVDTAMQLFHSLYGGEDSAVDTLGQARRELERLTKIDLDLKPATSSLGDAMFSVEDVATQLRNYAEGLDDDPARLQAARERLEEIRRLMRRHDTDLAGVIARGTELAGHEEQSLALADQIAAATGRQERAREEFSHLCLALSAKRRNSTRKLEERATAGLASLGMEHAVFAVELSEVEDQQSPLVDGNLSYAANASGIDRVEFYVSANRGERALPLTRVASGGELSRIMLVLKELIAESDDVVTLVFDEIDSGISGRVAAAVGRKLEALSRNRQTLVITHLPQIASVADAHFSVRKRESQNRTVTEVVELTDQARADEIAELLAGESVSEAALRHARELLK
ncbi:MAG: DNA repair protein RecN [Candidatus Latescibacterota bacterium]|nr:DNA repair protein RecN [Candidatus Latescibacterota bacterium]